MSGEDLSRELRISRTAVCGSMSAAFAARAMSSNLPHGKATCSGRCPTGFPSEIGAALRSVRMGRRIVYEREVDSTNRLARDLAIAGAAEGTIAVAEAQTAGRGRKGRSWFSPPGAGIYPSLVLRPGAGPQRRRRRPC